MERKNEKRVPEQDLYLHYLAVRGSWVPRVYHFAIRGACVLFAIIVLAALSRALGAVVDVLHF